MPAAIKVQKGDRYGRVTLIEERREGDRDRKFLVLCDCGTNFVVRLPSLRNGRTKSCGCLNRENRPKNNYKHGHNTRIKGTSRTYFTWASMIKRCKNPKDKSYSRYGGRGIKVCIRWLFFVNFLADMGERPPNKTIERINNNKGYSPRNCKWATVSEQNFNRRKWTWKKKN